MLVIDSRHNITLNTCDNGVIDFTLCGCDKLVNGDRVCFKCKEQDYTTEEFTNGVAKIQIDSKEEPFEGTYCIRVTKKDGRLETVISGKFVRKAVC